jgi:alpha-beta hydrolase superfamily lysophospholipase
MNEGSMKRNNRNDIRREYNFASMKGGVRGKYAARYRAGTNLVLLDPEVAQAFPTDAAVNQTLRAVMDMANDVRLPGRARRPRRPGRRGTPARV